MTERRWERITGGAALAAVVFAVVGLANWGNPQYNDSISSIKTLYVQHQHQILRSQFFFLLFGLAVLVFTVGLRSILERDAGQNYVLPAFAVGAGVLNAVWMMVWAAINGGLALVASQVSPGEIRLIIGVESAVDFFTGLSFGLVALTAALAMLEAGFFARWMVWFGAASGALAIAGDASILDPTGPLGGVGIIGFLGQLLFLIWLIVVGVSLSRHSPIRASARETSVRAEPVTA